MTHKLADDAFLSLSVVFSKVEIIPMGKLLQVERVNTDLITLLLRKTNGNQFEAARILGITRGSLRNKTRSLGIVIDQIIKVEEEVTSV
ncbi:helix-turn-helix domain-containing protein [Adhaeretor mobilis]|uniref:Global DNA-binding transcriptional dual regulator Fis n=1 Tax=Adhaeretor mobilis TaxID=1930276 RepID=A0A517N365_9BACT|nr:helix-turn-helix domain-containing protein [Adhaeretor mobilis]QDT01428.1 global DNA-binding transcriptional dual regulator Fis [Adhaeretor mobilis]